MAVLACAVTFLSGGFHPARADSFCSPTSFALNEAGRTVQFTAVFIASEGPMAIEVLSSSPLIALANEPNPASNVLDDGGWAQNWNSLITLDVGVGIADGQYEVAVRESDGTAVCTIDVRVGAVVIGEDPIVILPPATVAPAVPETPVADAVEPAAQGDEPASAAVDAADDDAPGEVTRPEGRSLVDAAIEDLAVVGRVMLLILAAGLLLTGVLWGGRKIVRLIRNRQPDDWDVPVPSVAERLEAPSRGLPLIDQSTARPRMRVLPDPPDLAPVPSSPAEVPVPEAARSEAAPSEPAPSEAGAGQVEEHGARSEPEAATPKPEAAEPELAEDALQSKATDKIASVEDLWDMDTYEPERLSERVAAVTTVPLERTSRSELPKPVRSSRRSPLRRFFQLRVFGGGHRRVRGPSMLQRLRLSGAGRRYGRWVARPRIKGPTMVGRLRNTIAREQRRAAPRWERPDHLADVVDVTLAARAARDADDLEEKIG